MTEAANTLAVFLRELTDGLSLRELAERYEGGKTLWGEYRSGAQIVPLSRLNTVVKDRVRDARGREVMLAKARQLHGHAMTAQSEAQPDLAVGEALRQAEQDIADMTRLIKVLVARIDALQDEAAKQTTDDGAEGTGLAEGSVTTIAAQLEVLRRHVEEARRVRDATRDAYDAAQSEAPAEQTGQDSASGQEPAAVQTQSGTELVGSLAQLHDTAARQREMLRLWDGDEGVRTPRAAAAAAFTEAAPRTAMPAKARRAMPVPKRVRCTAGPLTPPAMTPGGRSRRRLDRARPEHPLPSGLRTPAWRLPPPRRPITTTAARPRAAVMVVGPARVVRRSHSPVPRRGRRSPTPSPSASACSGCPPEPPSHS